MKRWMSALALTVAGAMLATSAFAQSGGAGSAGGSGSGAAGGSGSGAGASSTDKGSSPSGSGSTSGSGTMSGKSGRAAGGDAEKVKAVQQALKDKGHDPGDVDGKMGPKTQAALRDYQQKEGLKATGRLDSETAAKLGVQASTDTSSPAASPSGSTSDGAKTK